MYVNLLLLIVGNYKHVVVSYGFDILHVTPDILSPCNRYRYVYIHTIAETM